ncbi:MAG: hypothetical protein IPO63_10625 [Bacteroidetes bacterium]|nr:hypothetical protein [Bacteroidota bacterium]
MKTNEKLILTIAISLLCSSQIVAQWALGGNAVTTIEKLGTTTNYALPFITNNTEKARITTTGELGIGTTSPGAWLHILTNGSGTALSKDVFTTDVPTGSDTYWRMQKNGSDYARLLSFTGGNAFYIQAPRGHLRFASGTGGNATGAMEIREQGGADAGYVGIGNYSSFSPSCRLHLHEVTASTTIAFQISNNSTGYSSSDGFRILNDNSGRVTMYNWEDDDIAFGTGNSGGGGSLNERMVISSGLNYGRVGVSTNSPAAHLDVYDNIDISIGGDDIGFRVDEILQTSNSTNWAIGANVHAENGHQTIGIECNIDNTSSNTNVIMQGIYQRCRNTSTSNVSDAYNFYAQNDGACTPIRKYGFAAFMSGSGSTNTYGGYFYSNSSAGNNFGVWASAPDQTCTGGTSGSIGSCSGAAGYFNGEVWASGDIYEFSDANLKDNIVAIQNASSLLSQFSPKQYIRLIIKSILIFTCLMERAMDLLHKT